ncbi:MAG: PKD domain-containing protein, partial [Thermoplasmata archaeon]
MNILSVSTIPQKSKFTKHSGAEAKRKLSYSFTAVFPILLLLTVDSFLIIQAQFDQHAPAVYLSQDLPEFSSTYTPHMPEGNARAPFTHRIKGYVLAEGYNYSVFPVENALISIYNLNNTSIAYANCTVTLSNGYFSFDIQAPDWNDGEYFKVVARKQGKEGYSISELYEVNALTGTWFNITLYYEINLTIESGMVSFEIIRQNGQDNITGNGSYAELNASQPVVLANATAQFHIGPFNKGADKVTVPCRIGFPNGSEANYTLQPDEILEFEMDVSAGENRIGITLDPEDIYNETDETDNYLLYTFFVDLGPTVNISTEGVLPAITELYGYFMDETEVISITVNASSTSHPEIYVLQAASFPSPVSMPHYGIWNCTLNLSQFPSPAVNITVSVSDINSTTVCRNVLHLSAPNLAPSITVLNPPEGSEVHTLLNITGYVEDNLVLSGGNLTVKAAFLSIGQTPSNNDWRIVEITGISETGLTFQASFDISGFAEGNYTLYIYASDGWLVNITTFYYILRYPNVPPVGFLSISKNPVNVGEEIFLNASLSYDSDGTITGYFFDFGDGTTSGWIPQNIITHTYTMPGNYTLRLMVRDDDNATSGWILAPDALRVLPLGPSPPEVEITSPKDSELIEGVFRFSGTVQDDMGILNIMAVEIKFDDMDNATSYYAYIDQLHETFFLDIDTSTLLDGQHTVFVRAMDANGWGGWKGQKFRTINTPPSSITVTMQVEPSATYPQLTVSIRGTVFFNTGMPVRNGIVRIDIPGTDISVNVNTDSEGAFSLMLLSPSRPGNYTVSAFVYERGLAGSMERRLVILHPPSPDLALLEGNITHTPYSPKAGDYVTFSCIVSNLGTASGRCTLSLYLDSIAVNSLMYQTQTDGIEPGGYYIVQYQWTASDGRRSIYAVLSDFSAPDMNAENNMLVYNLTVLPKIDLGIYDLNLSNSRPYTGIPVEIRVGVKNFGTAVTEGRLTVSINNSDISGGGRLLRIQAGEVSYSTFTHTFLNAGKYEIKAVLSGVEDDDRMSNNQLVYQVTVSGMTNNSGTSPEGTSNSIKYTIIIILIVGLVGVIVFLLVTSPKKEDKKKQGQSKQGSSS